MKYKCKKCRKNIGLANYIGAQLCDRCADKKSKPAKAFKYFK